MCNLNKFSLAVVGNFTNFWDRSSVLMDKYKNVDTK